MTMLSQRWNLYVWHLSYKLLKVELNPSENFAQSYAWCPFCVCELKINPLHRTGERPWLYKEKGSGSERDRKKGALTVGV